MADSPPEQEVPDPLKVDMGKLSPPEQVRCPECGSDDPAFWQYRRWHDGQVRRLPIRPGGPRCPNPFHSFPVAEGPERWTICRKCANEGACNPCEPIEVVPAQALDFILAEAERSAAELRSTIEAWKSKVSQLEAELEDARRGAKDAYKRLVADLAEEKAKGDGWLKRAEAAEQTIEQLQAAGDELAEALEGADAASFPDEAAILSRWRSLRGNDGT